MLDGIVHDRVVGGGSRHGPARMSATLSHLDFLGQLGRGSPQGSGKITFVGAPLAENIAAVVAGEGLGIRIGESGSRYSAAGGLGTGRCRVCRVSGGGRRGREGRIGSGLGDPILREGVEPSVAHGDNCGQ